MSTIPNFIPSHNYLPNGSGSDYLGMGASDRPRPNPPPVFARYDSIWNEDKITTRMIMTSENPHTKWDPPLDKHEGITFYVLRTFDRTNKEYDTALVMKSTYLCEILKIVLKDENTDNRVVPGYTKLDPHVLYNYLDDFRNFDFDLNASTESAFIDPELSRTHLTGLIYFLQTEYEPDRSSAESLLTLNPPHITYDLLWYIFKPRTLIFSPPTAYELPRLYKYESMNSRLGVSLTLSHITYVDKGASYSPSALHISSFKGVKKVSELQIFPFEYYIKRAQMEIHLEERGRRYIDICEKGKQYVCRAMKPKDQHRNYDSRLVIDPKRYSIEKGASYYPVGDLDRIHYQICSCFLWGFSMEDKAWEQVDIDKITDIIWKEDMLDNVVLEPATKTMIKGLINNHDSADPNIIEDIMPGKGSGLIMLFSGPPGIGKTLIAEAVAEATHRPTYRISTNDLGCDPENLEYNLRRILNRGSEWNLVVLIDEADVFLEQRTGLDVTRNSLVSIFLRELEYYKGILILTTNRLETIDRSLESRIHFKLRFPEMNKASRIQLWQLFLKDKSDNISYREIQQLSEFKLNGRMIKHAASLGLALSKIQNESLAFTHIKSGLRFIDPSLSIDRESSARFDDYNCASPLDPGMTPGQTADTPGGSRDISGELIHAEPSHRRQSEDIRRDGFGLGRASKRPRFS